MWKIIFLMKTANTFYQFQFQMWRNARTGMWTPSPNTSVGKDEQLVWTSIAWACRIAGSSKALYERFVSRLLIVCMFVFIPFGWHQVAHRQCGDTLAVRLRVLASQMTIQTTGSVPGVLRYQSVTEYWCSFILLNLRVAMISWEFMTARPIPVDHCACYLEIRRLRWILLASHCGSNSLRTGVLRSGGLMLLLQWPNTVRI